MQAQKYVNIGVIVCWVVPHFALVQIFLELFHRVSSHHVWFQVIWSSKKHKHTNHFNTCSSDLMEAKRASFQFTIASSQNIVSVIVLPPTGGDDFKPTDLISVTYLKLWKTGTASWLTALWTTCVLEWQSRGRTVGCSFSFDFLNVHLKKVVMHHWSVWTANGSSARS